MWMSTWTETSITNDNCNPWFVNHSLVFCPQMEMNKLEMLSQREQLMEDIDCIIESNFGEVEYKDDVIRMLCDAVIKNFPTN